MKETDLHKLIVKVNAGSGCLFQPLSNDFSYVLTARHVLDISPLLITRQLLDASGKQKDIALKIIGGPYFHQNDQIDAAIIKVQKLDGIDNLLRDEPRIDNEYNYHLCGHPKSRDKNEFSFRNDHLRIIGPKPLGYKEGELQRNAIYKEIVGQSGGGIIRIEEGCFLLAGIQKQMTSDDEDESLSRIDFMPLDFFDQIIQANTTELCPLFPPYIDSFLHLIKDIFPLKNAVKKDLIKNVLEVIAKPLCDSFSPKKIIELYSDTLLVHGTDRSMVYRKELWISFLELLAISQLHSEDNLTFEDIKNIHKKRKLYFTDSSEWSTKLEDIYRSDLSEIEKDGFIVVSTTDSISSLLEIPKGFVPDIGIVPEQMSISCTVKEPFQDLRVVHIYKFQHHIINNVELFNKISAANAKQHIRDNTNGIF